MLELLKDIDIKNMSIKEIYNTLNDVAKEVGEYPYEKDVDLDEKTKYDLHRICLIMQNTNIYDLNYFELEKYINKLIVLIEFVLDE